LDEAVSDPIISTRAKALGEKLQDENGVDNAVQAILKIMEMQDHQPAFRASTPYSSTKNTPMLGVY
jgi:hypothetical protein